MSNSHHPLPSPQSRIVPKFIERTPQGERQWDPYTKLFDERIIFLGIPIYDEVANTSTIYHARPQDSDSTRLQARSLRFEEHLRQWVPPVMLRYVQAVRRRLGRIS